MKTRTIVSTLSLCFLTAAVCHAGDPQMGTWKLNEAKSKLTPRTTKNSKVVYESEYGDVVKVTVDGTDAHGKPAHNQWRGKFDGKFYPLTGDPDADARAYKKIDDHTLGLSLLKNKKVTTTGRIVVAADGKSRTVSVHGKTPKGKKFKNTAVYDKD